MYRVSIIMPALNEAANIDSAISNVVETFSGLGVVGEIIVVDDGSRDGTGARVETWMKNHPWIRMIRHENPQGIGASFWDGIAVAQGEIVSMLPGDGENDAQEILKYLPLMEYVDIIAPFVCNTGVRSRGRQVISRIYTRIIDISFGLKLNYYNGTGMYRRSVFKGIELKSRGFFYSAELLIKTIRKGYLYAEVPCLLRARARGGSKALTWKSFSSLLRAYFSTLASVYLTRPSETEAINSDSITGSSRGL